jgi:hypothetical protein
LSLARLAPAGGVDHSGPTAALSMLEQSFNQPAPNAVPAERECIKPPRTQGARHNGIRREASSQAVSETDRYASPRARHRPGDPCRLVRERDSGQLEPLEFSFGTRFSLAARCLPERNSVGSVTVTANALAVIEPISGMVSKASACYVETMPRVQFSVDLADRELQFLELLGSLVEQLAS